MIIGVKIISQFGENNRVTEFTYNGYSGGWLTEKFNNATQEDFDKFIKECEHTKGKKAQILKQIEEERARMTPEERTRQDEADRAVFERWQDEANTNAYLDGVIIEGEDPDFNPFRKSE